MKLTEITPEILDKALTDETKNDENSPMFRLLMETSKDAYWFSYESLLQLNALLNLNPDSEDRILILKGLFLSVLCVGIRIGNKMENDVETPVEIPSV